MASSMAPSAAISSASSGPQNATSPRFATVLWTPKPPERPPLLHSQISDSHAVIYEWGRPRRVAEPPQLQARHRCPMPSLSGRLSRVSLRPPWLLLRGSLPVFLGSSVVCVGSEWPFFQLTCRKPAASRRTAPRGAVRRPFPAAFHFAESIRSGGRRTHGEDPALRPRTCEDGGPGSLDRRRRNGGEGEAAEEGAAEMPGLRTEMRVPRPRTGEALEGDGPGEEHVPSRVPACEGGMPRARRARRARALGEAQVASRATSRTGPHALP